MDLCIAKFICLMCRYVDVYVLACIFTFLLNLVIVCIFVMFSSYIFYSVPSACVYVILLIFCNSNVLIRGGKLSCSKTKRKKKQNEKLSRRVGYLYIFLYQAIEAGWSMLKSAFKFEELRKHEINKHFGKNDWTWMQELLFSLFFFYHCVCRFNFSNSDRFFETQNTKSNLEWKDPLNRAFTSVLGHQKEEEPVNYLFLITLSKHRCITCEKGRKNSKSFSIS